MRIRFEIVRDTPLVEGALAQLVARVVRSYWGGDHSLFLGQVEYVRYGEGTPLLFHGGRYERVVRDPHVFAALPRSCWRPILAAARAKLRGRRDDHAHRRARRLALARRGGHGRVERPGKLVRLGVGELLGEIEVLDGGPRIADITAENAVRCLEITRLSSGRARGGPRAAMALIEVLAGRFRETA